VTPTSRSPRQSLGSVCDDFNIQCSVAFQANTKEIQSIRNDLCSCFKSEVRAQQKSLNKFEIREMTIWNYGYIGGFIEPTESEESAGATGRNNSIWCVEMDVNANLSPAHKFPRPDIYLTGARAVFRGTELRRSAYAAGCDGLSNCRFRVTYACLS